MFSGQTERLTEKEVSPGEKGARQWGKCETDIPNVILQEIIKLVYRKVPKFSDARKLCCNLPTIQTNRPSLRVFHQQDENGIANSEDPDQTAPGSALFAQTNLYENLGSVWYDTVVKVLIH